MKRGAKTKICNRSRKRALRKLRGMRVGTCSVSRAVACHNSSVPSIECRPRPFRQSAIGTGPRQPPKGIVNMPTESLYKSVAHATCAGNNPLNGSQHVLMRVHMSCKSGCGWAGLCRQCNATGKDVIVIGRKTANLKQTVIVWFS
ncbi:TonB-denpendent receptor [Anopheles sinensis]|uniref:TonB-denpendent receptor n=1 Tax=Anopheles sinensis TaxID=74873 RepID=A0A084V9X8_ANOSI|nr:TonB-denpendent receptor [Anopheles sinensis]